MVTRTAKVTKGKVKRRAKTSRGARRTQDTEGLVAAVRRKLGLSRKVFSRLTGFSERAIANWENGGNPDEPGVRRIRETERFQARLAEVVRPEAIPQWL